MQHSYHKKATLKNRTLSMLLAVALVLSVLAVGFGVTSFADSVARTYYFDTSQNYDWNPSGSGESLVATFTSSSGAQVGGTVTLSAVGSNLYRVSAPAGAENIQLYVQSNTMPPSAPAANTKRVFFNNKPNWHTPSVYAFNGDSDNNGWHSDAGKMTRIGSTSYYYFDVPTRYGWIIFNDGVTANSSNGNGQTEDIKMSSAGDNPVFSKGSGTSWDTAPYYRQYANVSLSSRPSGANEMYALDNGTVVFSKYAYTGSDPRSFTQGDQIYLYAPSWASANVTWDLDDPYHIAVAMTPTAVNGEGGFFTATVPRGAKIQFSYNYASSNPTTYTTGSDSNCYNMRNSANIWCKPQDAVRGELTDYSAPVESSGHNSKDAFWVDAVYYDYLSDTELTNGWLKPIQAGTGHNSSNDDWYEHYQFNNFISSYANTNGVTMPLYFGNFCNTPKSYGADYEGLQPHGGPYGNAINGLKNFYYYINNSNGLTNRHFAVQGLAGSSLDADGNILYASGARMPYFDSTWLKNNTVNQRSIGTTVRSSFPFRTSVTGKGTREEVTTYKFDSQGAKDNVFFNWDGANNAPGHVGYGQGTVYGVQDGLKYFMYGEDIDQDTGKKYKESTYYGIFPFNKPSGSNGSGNNNLDYGFGIKMEMDFRIPAHNGVSGVLPNGQDCTFEFSGDDDLWVYITEYNDDGSLGNSYLALDLGGNHKKAEGKINFHTMQATTAKIDNSIQTQAAQAKTGINFKSDTMYFEDSYNWGSMWMHAWSGENKDFQMGSVTINGKKYFTATKAQMGSAQNFLVQKANGDWNNKSADATVKAHYGNVSYSNNPNWIDSMTTDVSGTSAAQGLTYTSSPVYVNGGSPLDPNKTYHMSVFYMERGYLESNCKIEFTMTPANNDLKVKKNINTANVNPGLRSDVEAKSFNFTTTENSAVNTSAAYRLNSESATRTVSGSGVYSLKDEDVADFDNQYMTGSKLMVKETLPNTGMRYGTPVWEVINNSNGDLIANGRGAQTDVFDFSNADNSYVTRQVNFTNTPQVQDLNIEKHIVDENGQQVELSDQFEFKLLVNLKGNTYSSATASEFKPYRLRYVAHTADGNVTLYTGDDGLFRFMSDDKITVSGLPVGASYVLIESPKAGYMPYKVNGADFNGTFTSVMSSTGANVSITNKQKPITTSMKIRKFVEKSEGTSVTDYYYVNGSLFSFTAEGLGEVEFKSDGSLTKDASSMTKTVGTTDANGEATFSNSGASDNFLKFNQPGTYAFKIYESDKVNGNTADYFDQELYGTSYFKTYKHDFSTDSTVYLALFTVTPDPSNVTELIVEDPVYYKYNGTGAINRSAFTADKILTSGDMTYSGDSVIPEFVNDVKTGSVKVVKSNDSQGTNKLSGVEFSLYKVDYDGDEENVTSSRLVDTLGTNTDGIAQFTNLDLYELSEYGDYEGKPAYQWYALRETKTKNGHVHNKTIAYFTLPMVDSQSGELKYDITFDYVNGAIKNPETAGSGMAAVKYTGLAIIVLASVLLASYVLFNKKNKKRAHAPAHLKK